VAGRAVSGGPSRNPKGWAYNNNGYVLLGQIVAKLRGGSYIDAVNNYIATPWVSNTPDWLSRN